MDKKTIRILTFGSCGWDRIFYKNKDGNEGELIYEEEGRKNSHQAVAVKRAGADSTLVSFVGDDEIGKKCLESLNKCGINTKYIAVAKGENTEINHQLLDRETKDYDLKRFASPLSQWYGKDTVKQYEKEILSSNFVILVSKQPHDFLIEAINFCHENKIPTIITVSHPKLDIEKREDFETLKRCTYIAGNFKEVEALTNKSRPKDMLKILPNLLITKGEEGVWFCDENGNVCHEKAVPAEKVVETNGAGDTFLGYFVVSYIEGKSITESVRIGMCASTIEVSKMGVVNAIPFREEVEELHKRHYKNS